MLGIVVFSIGGWPCLVRPGLECRDLVIHVFSLTRFFGISDLWMDVMDPQPGRLIDIGPCVDDALLLRFARKPNYP